MFGIKVLYTQYISKQNWQLPELLLIPILLLILLSIYFWPVLFRGFVLLPADMIFEFPFFREAAPPDFQHASNALLSDMVLKFYPWHTVAREAIQNGQFPFWNPYIYAGTPLFANAESAILYPINLVGYLLPLDAVFAFSAIVRMFIGGLGTYLFLRALKVNEFGASVSAVTFMFGGSMIVWLNYPVSSTYVWMPLLFFLGERFLVRRTLIYIPLISLVVGIQILGGHYQTSFMILVAWWLYCMYRMFQVFRRDYSWRQVTYASLLLASGVILGILLVAVQLLPFWEWLNQTNETQFRLEERASAVWIEPSFWKGAIVTFVTLVLPNFFGNPTWGDPTNFFYSNYIEQMVYMGIVPISLAIVAALGSKSKATPLIKRSIEEREASSISKAGLILFLAGLGLFFLGMALRLPGIDLMNHLPVFNVVASERYRLIFTFFVAVLAGLGAERIFYFSLGTAVFRYLLLGLIVFAGMGTILLIAVHWVLVIFKDFVTDFNRIDTLYPIMMEAFTLSKVTMYLPILIALAFAGVIILYRKHFISPQLSQVSLFGLILVDLFVFGHSFNPMMPKDQIFPRTEAVEFLQDRLGQEPMRIIALNDDLPPNTGTPYRFFEITGSDFPARRYLELALALGGELIGHNRITFVTLHPRLLDLMNIKYVVASVELEAGFSNQLQEVYQTPSVKIYENLNYLPRAYVVHQVEIIDKDAEILDMLISSSVDPSNRIIIEEPPPVELLKNQASFNDSVQIVQYQSQQITIETQLAADGFLFLSDVYYPGWQAFVDGQETRIYRANYAFKALYLPKGPHSVRFIYTPPSLELGLTITLIGLALTLMIFVVSWKKQTQPNMLLEDT